MNNENKIDKYLLIVNKEFPLTKEKEAWLDENFEYVSYTDEDGQSRMEYETFRAYISLVNLIKKKYHINIDSHSAWRSVATQEQVYQDSLKTHSEEWVKTHVAIPGESEHHTGLAFDIRLKYTLVPKFLKAKVNSITGKIGLRKKIFKIIEREAVQFGLIKRYQAEKEDITGFKEEDWHFRYVGIEHAKAMYESNMCLEEYVKELKLKSENAKVATH